MERAKIVLRWRGEGRSTWLSITARPLLDGSGVPCGGVAVVRDITAQVEAEQQLLQSERLAAIGQMVAGVAHESRNALGMAITRRIVEAHGGQIAVGAPGMPGTEILITLPRGMR